MAVQGDGKLVVAGGSVYSVLTPDFVVVRYNTDGSLDTSFGDAGKVITNIRVTPFGSRDVATALAIQSDGKIVVAGSSDGDFAIVRYNQSGSPDTSFDGDGIVTTDIGAGSNDGASAIAIQGNGRLVVAGGSNGDFAVARYNTDGTPDLSFGGGDGKLTTGIAANTFDTATALRIQIDNKLVVTGDSRDPSFTCPVTNRTMPGSSRFAVVRYNVDGSLDPTFDGDGIVTTTSGYFNNAKAMALQTGFVDPHKIVVVGETANLTGGCAPSNPPFVTTPSDIMIVRYNDNGSLDTSLDGDGILVDSTSAGSDGANAVAVQSSMGNPSRIFVAGYSSNGSDSDVAVVKYLVNGTRDTAFDGDGLVTTPMGTGSDDVGYAMTFQSGKMVVAGSSYGTNFDYALARYSLSNGALDPAFDGDGKRIDDLTDAIAYGKSVAVQPDGKLIVVGYANDGTYDDFAVARYHPDGTLDSSFDGDGKTTTPITVRDYASAVTVQADGKILVVGSSGENFAVVRYLVTGSLDPSFGGGDGIVTTPVGTGSDFAQAVAVQADGKIVVAGAAYVGSTYDFAVVRYHTDGSLDFSFEVDGKAITAIGSSRDEGNAVVLQTDGKIVVAGSVFNGTHNDFGAVRYNPDGSLDTSFHFDGKVTTQVGAASSSGAAMAIQTNGRILVAGSADNGANVDFAIIRYNTNGSLDTSFDGDGIALTPIGADYDAASAIALQTNGKIVVAGTSGGDFAVVRYNTTGSLDTSFGGGYGGVTIDVSDGGNDSGHGTALDASGDIVVVGTSDGIFGATRLLGGGSAPAVVSAVSRKMHGTPTFDIPLPLTAPAGVECRIGGAGGSHRVLVTFANSVSVGGLSITSRDGLATGSHSASGAVVTVNLSSVANAQTLGITLVNVNDGTTTGNVFIPMGVLVGDTTGNGTVSASDIGQTKAASGQSVTGANFRLDVTASGGSINASDIGLVKSSSGTQLP